MSNPMNDSQIEEAVAKSPAPRITKEYMESRIVDVQYFSPPGESTTTYCRMVIDNGYAVSGESACVNPENYNRELGQSIAYNNAFAKLWPLFGFLLAEGNYRAQQAA